MSSPEPRGGYEAARIRLSTWRRGAFAPRVAKAQQAAMPVIGFLNPAVPDTNADRLRAYRQGLKEAGYTEGENVAIDYPLGREPKRPAVALADELVRRRVAVIVAVVGTPPAFAAKATTATIPILFAVGEDPVRLGLVASLARPGGNLTGVNFFNAELTAKRLELLRELMPAAARVAVLVNPTNAVNTETTLRDVTTAARVIGLQIQVLNATTSREIDAAFAHDCARAARCPIRSAATHFSTAGECSLPTPRRAMRFQRHL